MRSLHHSAKAQKREVWRVELSSVKQRAADALVQCWHVVLRVLRQDDDVCWDLRHLEVGVYASQEIVPGPQRRHADEFVNS
jgi:hypothetical protein